MNMEQITDLILENGLTSPIVIIALGTACVYLYKKYEEFAEQTRKTQEDSYTLITDIQRTLNESAKNSEELNEVIKNLQARIQGLELELNSIHGNSSHQMTEIIKDIESIKRFLEMCCVLNNRKRVD